MIDYEDIDTPTWLREQRSAFIERCKAMCWGRGIGETVAPTPGGLFDLLIERTVWKSPVTGTWQKAVVDAKLWTQMLLEREPNDHASDALRYSLMHRKSTDKHAPCVIVGVDMAVDK